MREPIVFYCMSLCFLAAAYVLCIKNLHIFQLNSYKPDVQKKWVRDNIGAIAARTVWALGAVFLAKGLGVLGLALSGVLFLAVMVLNLPGKAKTPLKYTFRVKRLIASYMLIHIAAVVIGAVVPAENRAFFAMLFSVMLAGAPWLILAANTVNRPMEKAISDKYVRQAKKLLEDMPGMLVVGVTGSYGKTSVKFFLEKLLSVKYNVLITPENYNTTLGVVRTIRERLRATHEIFVCEMGARNVGDIDEICRLVHPKMGVITAIGPQHLESFGSIENIVKTKFELADSLPEDGVLFLNEDNEYIRARKVQNAVGYGTEHGEYRAENIRVGPGGSSFTVKGVEFTTRLLGRHNVQNICAAIAVAAVLGVPIEKMVQPVRRLESVPHRLRLMGGGDRLIIDDAYNSNPAGAEAALDVLAGFDGCRILVTPGMVELGEKQYELNRQLGRHAAKCCDYAILIGEKHAEPIKKGLLEEGFPPERITVAESFDRAMAIADAQAAERRVILLENDLPDNY